MSTKFRDKDDGGGIPDVEPTGGKLPQILTAIILNILAMGVGASFGIPNVFYVQLKPENCIDPTMSTSMTTVLPNSNLSNPELKECPFTINTDQKSLITYSGIVGMYSTLFFAVPVVSRFGKRKSMMLDSILSLIAFIFMAAAQNVGMLCISKLLLGYVSLTCRAAIQPFIAETSNPNIRGFTTSLYVLFYISGQAFSVTIANHFDDGWRYTAAGFGALMVVCLLSLAFWIHETPDWLLEKRFFQQATKALEFYKIDREILVADENKRKTVDGRHKSYHEIVDLYEEEAERSPLKEKSKRRIFSEKVKHKTKVVIATFKRPEVYKPFILLTFILAMTDLSGFVVMANFSGDLVSQYGYGENTFVNALDFTAIILATRIPSSFLAMGVLGKFKKRPVYLCAAFSLLIILVGLITFTFLLTNGTIPLETFENNVGLQIVPMILFILFYATFSFGYGNIPFSLMGELFPTNASSIANTGVFILSNLGSVIAAQTALSINEAYGLPYVFFIPASAVIGNIILAAIFLPETYGLTMEEIGQIYGGKIDKPKEEIPKDETPKDEAPKDETPVEVKMPTIEIEEEEEEEVPYYHKLRSEMNMELMNAIKRRKSVFAWPSVGGALQVDSTRQSIRLSESNQLKTNDNRASVYAF